MEDCGCGTEAVGQHHLQRYQGERFHLPAALKLLVHSNEGLRRNLRDEATLRGFWDWLSTTRVLGQVNAIQTLRADRMSIR